MKKHVFGNIEDQAVEQITLESADAAVSILSFGCVVRDWRVDGDRGSLPMVLGFPDMGAYFEHSRSHGAVVGRVANRTSGAEFDLDGQKFHLTKNEGGNHLHGGNTGLGRRVWSMERDSSSESVELTCFSPDGEEGYPGNVEFRVRYRLEGATLICDMFGLPDRPTPLSLIQHTYYNLAGGGDVLDHHLSVDATQYLPVSGVLIPDGTMRPVDGTRFDFREMQNIGSCDPERLGLDLCMVLREGRDSDKPAATAKCERTGLAVRVFTDEPGMQVFNASDMVIEAPGHDGARYGQYAGLCLEAQHFPDSLHNPQWPEIIRSPELPYQQQLKVEISNR